MNNKILQYLIKRGECPASEIAQATKIPLTEVHLHLAELKAKNQVMLCDSITFMKGKEIRSTICRISGYIPPAKPGAKSKKQLVL
jgi:hypothetical protein